MQPITGFDNDLMLSAEDTQLGPLSRIRVSAAGDQKDLGDQRVPTASHKALSRAVALPTSALFTFHEARAFVVSALSQQ